MTASMSLGRGGIGLNATTSYNPAARRFYKILKEVYNVEASIVTHRNNKLQKRIIYDLALPPQEGTQDIFNYMAGIPDGNSYNLGHKEDTFFDINCCPRAYLRGAYLGSGYINNPEGEYHLEMLCHNESHAEFICKLLEPFEIFPKIVERKKQNVLYLKGSEQIADFLNLIGAHHALLEFENVRVLKEMRNNINRQTNCETANVDKTVNTGMRQVLAIEKLQRLDKFKDLDDGLKEVALLRLENREVSLAEIGEMMSEPISKSGVNHRLRKIEKIAEKF